MTTQDKQIGAQAGPEVVAWAMPRDDGLFLDVICPEEHESYEGDYTVPLITLQSHREAVAKRDAALLAAVEAGKLVRELGARFFSMPRSVSARSDFEIALNATGRAITQAEKALKG